MERGKREKEHNTRTEQFFPFSLKFLLFCLTFFTFCADNFYYKLCNICYKLANTCYKLCNACYKLCNKLFLIRQKKNIRQKGRIILGKGGNVSKEILLPKYFSTRDFNANHLILLNMNDFCKTLLRIFNEIPQ